MSAKYAATTSPVATSSVDTVPDHVRSSWPALRAAKLDVLTAIATE
jgi:hypothetical protein